MLKTASKVLALSIALLSLPVWAQKITRAEAGLSGCGDPRATFKVKESNGQNPAQPEAGKALVYFIEEDINTNFIIHTSLAGLDGKWVGATHGDSYLYFPVDPGLHHLCAATRFGSSSDSVQPAVAHFTAEAGSVYYFEVKNISWPDADEHDATLFPLDSDEGKYLTYALQLVVSRQN